MSTFILFFSSDKVHRTEAVAAKRFHNQGPRLCPTHLVQRKPEMLNAALNTQRETKTCTCHAARSPTSESGHSEHHSPDRGSNQRGP